MLRLRRRHSRRCSQKSEKHRRCSCPIYCEGTVGGEPIRKSLDLTSWEAATNLIHGWQQAGRIGGPIAGMAPVISIAVDRYLADAKTRGLKPSSPKNTGSFSRITCRNRAFAAASQISVS